MRFFSNGVGGEETTDAKDGFDGDDGVAEDENVEGTGSWDDTPLLASGWSSCNIVMLNCCCSCCDEVQVESDDG